MEDLMSGFDLAKPKSANKAVSGLSVEEKMEAPEESTGVIREEKFEDPGESSGTEMVELGEEEEPALMESIDKPRYYISSVSSDGKSVMLRDTNVPNNKKNGKFVLYQVYMYPSVNWDIMDGDGDKYLYNGKDLLDRSVKPKRAELPELAKRVEVARKNAKNRYKRFLEANLGAKALSKPPKKAPILKAGE